MKTSSYWVVIIITIIVSGCEKSSGPTSQTTKQSNTQHVSVVTQHNNISRDGLNAHETLLTDFECQC
ncbi:MAG: hypothetical protein QM734_13575 [Cyclobacteriaceae bacterium]